jgi:gliding motility-associated protein GldM
MLALNVAAEVLEAFRVVDSSLTQTIRTVEMKNSQVYGSFEQAFIENKTKVQEWKDKADLVRKRTDSLITRIWNLKENLVMTSGGLLITGETELRPDDPFFVKQSGDTIKIKKEDDLNTPSEMMITQNMAEELKKEIELHKIFLTGIINENDSQLKETILQELDTSDPPAKTRDGGEKVSWEVQHFDNKPLIAVITLLSKLQIDIINAESHIINYLFSQIDAGSFKFNKLGAKVIANSNVILQGDEYVATVFLAAEDTTQSPEIFVNNRPLKMVDGKGIYRINANQAGTFKWSGLIKYKTPEGIFQEYPFEQEYQVTEPTVNVSATKMNLFYLGIANPIDIAAGSLPRENIKPTMTNGRIEKIGDNYFVHPTATDIQGKNTKVSLFANVGGVDRLMGTTNWRVKRVPDPVAQIAGLSSGDIQRARLAIQDGIAAVLEDFDFDFKYTVTQFDVWITNAQGYTSNFKSTSNRFTKDQKDQFKRLIPGSILYIDNIEAKGDDNSVRPLKPISFKIQ